MSGRSSHQQRAQHGFTLTELVMVVAILGTVMALAIPATLRVSEDMRLQAATRELEQQLQTARLKAVTTNRPMRVRLNCPATGQYRMVEVTGIAATDDASNRCNETAFPYPGARDTNPATPAHDGPVRYVDSRVSVSIAEPNLVLEFTPSGQTFKVVSNTLQLINGSQQVSVQHKHTYRTKMVTINALGKIQLQ